MQHPVRPTSRVESGYRLRLELDLTGAAARKGERDHDDKKIRHKQALLVESSDNAVPQACRCAFSGEICLEEVLIAAASST